MKIHYSLILFFISGSLALGLFNNCGASKSGGSSDQASRADITGPSTNGSNERYLSDCNQIPSNSMNLEGPISTFIDAQTNQYVNDVLRLRLNKTPLELISTSSHYLQFFRWKEQTAGARQYNGAPVEMYFQLVNTGEWVQDEPVTVLSRATIQKLIEDNNLGMPPEDFFNGVVIALDGMDLEWDAMTIALYDDSRGTEAINQVDLLLPAFAADPNRYAIDHVPNLANLHPLNVYKNNGMSEAQLYEASRSLCSGF